MGVKIQTIKDIRFYLARELQVIYKEPEIRTIANMLIKTITGITKLHELYNDSFLVYVEDAERIVNYTEELKTGKPIQYVLGETPFYNCTIKLNSSTLIPRPETEELVDLIIKENKGYTGNIIDFGTGSGCIAIALASNLPLSVITGVDISEEAIKIARENAVLNNVKVSFIKDDIFNFTQKTVGKSGIIVSNPPYVRNSEKLLMNKNVLEFEPPLALFVSDSNPLVYYEAIARLAEEFLLKDGILYFEINEMMGSSLSSLLELYGYTDIKVISDINDKERIIKGRKNV
jgi:release factor glutamine methyltransferase